MRDIMKIVSNIKFGLALVSLSFLNSIVAEASSAYPDFTAIVEQNMPAVVIVNASK